MSLKGEVNFQGSRNDIAVVMRVLLTLSFALTSAPDLINNSAIAVQFFSAAEYKGLTPRYEKLIIIQSFE